MIAQLSSLKVVVVVVVAIAVAVVETEIKLIIIISSSSSSRSSLVIINKNIIEAQIIKIDDVGDLIYMYQK